MLVKVKHKPKLKLITLMVMVMLKLKTLLQAQSVLLQNRWKQLRDLKLLDLARIELHKLILLVRRMKSLLLTSSLSKQLMMMIVLLNQELLPALSCSRFNKSHSHQLHPSSSRNPHQNLIKSNSSSNLKPMLPLNNKLKITTTSLMKTTTMPKTDRKSVV